MSEQTAQVALYGGLFMFAMMAFGILFFIVAYRSRQIQHLRERERMTEFFSSELQKARSEMTEITLKRVAQELHDNIGQSLSVLLLEARNRNVEFPGKFDSSVELLDKVIVDLRAVSHSLSSYALELGLREAITRELNRMKRAGGFEVDLECFVYEGQLSEGMEISEQERDLLLFRCIQELLSNVIRHSGAKKVKVNMWSAGERWAKIEVEDDGVGMPETAGTKGIGFKSIRDRLKLLGGTITVSSGEGKGTRIILGLN